MHMLYINVFNLFLDAQHLYKSTFPSLTNSLTKLTHTLRFNDSLTHSCYPQSVTSLRSQNTEFNQSLLSFTILAYYSSAIPFPSSPHLLIPPQLKSLNDHKHYQTYINKRICISISVLTLIFNFGFNLFSFYYLKQSSNCDRISIIA